MLTLGQSETIIDTAFAYGQQEGFKPLCVVVVDAGGHMMAMKRSEKASIYRPQIAMGKASACIGLGLGGKTVQSMGEDRPVFFQSLSQTFPNGCVPVQGGVLIRCGEGHIIGAVGVTGDLSPNDEACAVAGIKAAKLTADCG